MKTTIQLRVKTPLCFLSLVILSLVSSSSHAKVTTTLLTESFSGATSGSFPPSGWSSASGFVYGSGNGIDLGTGDAGFNGSAMWDVSNSCGGDFFYSPQIDASTYTGPGGTVYVEFDYWMERNSADLANGGSHFVVSVNDGLGNNVLLSELWTSSDFTFDNSANSTFYYDPLSDPTLWKHKKYAIPASQYTPAMSLQFFGEAYYNCSGGNIGIDNVVVTGEIVQNISYLPSNLSFGAALVGSQSSPLCVTLTNPTTIDVAINAAMIQGLNAPEFSVAGPIPSTIPAGSTADICVIFAPNANGVRNATLHIDNASDNYPLLDISLDGAGNASTIRIDAIGNINTSSKMFKKTFTKLGASLEQCLLVKNIGQAMLSIDPASFIGGGSAGSYSISRLPASPLAPGQSDTICVLYSPRQEGTAYARLSILNNASNGTQSVDLFGTGIVPKISVTPNRVYFDSVGIGDTACKKLTIYNPGSDTLRIKKSHLSSNDGDFTLSNLVSEQALILPGTSRDLTICFAPIGQGSRQARIVIFTNIPQTFDVPTQDTSLVEIDVAGNGVPFGKLSLSLGDGTTFDSVLVGTQDCRKVTLTNGGDADMTVTSAVIGGAQSSDFVLSNVTLPLTISARSSVDVTVCATPGARGLRQGSLMIGAVSNGLKSGGALPIGVYGQITCASPAPIALFNNLKIVKGGLDTQSVTITNCGDRNATYATAITGDGYSILSTGGSISLPTPPGGSVTFQILFNPTIAGISNGNLLIKSADVADMNIPLNGEGACATLTTQTPEVPMTAVGAMNSFDIVITNSGNFDWSPGSGIMTPGDVFTVVSITPATIPPGMTGTLKIQFKPSVVGLSTAQLTFPDAGPCQESDVKVNLSGEGVVSSVKQVSADGISLDQNYPNPFMGSTTFNYSLPTEQTVRIILCDMTGKVVKELVSGRVSGGEHSVTFDASNLSSGSYTYLLESGSTRLSKNLVLSK